MINFESCLAFHNIIKSLDNFFGSVILKHNVSENWNWEIWWNIYIYLFIHYLKILPNSPVMYSNDY